MSRRRTPVSWALALPPKGAPQRRTAQLGYGILATAVVFTGTFSVAQTADESVAAKGPAEALPDADPDAGDVYRRKPKQGYVPTYFDGRGGIAGVQLTEEQRAAVVKEALRRGVSAEDAHSLAYGESNVSTPDAEPEAKSPTFGGSTVLAAGPVYREIAPAEMGKSGDGSGGEGPLSNGDGSSAPQTYGRRDAEKPGKEESGKPQSKGFKENLKRSADAILPDAIEGPVEDLVGRLLPFKSYMKAISAPGSAPTFMVSEPEDGMVTVTAESKMTDSMIVTVEVKAPVEETPDAPPSTVSVTVTDPQTDTVTVATETQTIEGHDDIPRVAIGEVVEAVVTAATDSDVQPGEVAVKDEVVEGAGKDRETLPEAGRPRPSATGEADGPGRP